MADFSRFIPASFKFTPIEDGQEFKSKPVNDIFDDLESGLNGMSEAGIAEGALNFEHMNTNADLSGSYVYDSSAMSYAKDAIHSGGSPGVFTSGTGTNQMTSAASSFLDYYPKGDGHYAIWLNKHFHKLPVLKSSGGLTVLGFSKEPAELLDQSKKNYCSGALVLFDMDLEKIENTSGAGSADWQGYFILKAYISVNDAAYEWVPVPVTERFVDNIDNDTYKYPDIHHAVNFRHFFSKHSVPFGIPTSPTGWRSSLGLGSIKSIKLAGFSVACALISGATGEPGFFWNNWHLDAIVFGGNLSHAQTLESEVWKDVSEYGPGVVSSVEGALGDLVSDDDLGGGT